MRALLFCIDILPHGNRVQTSGGSLRSQQFADAFAASGYEVTKAVPSQSLLVKTQRHLLEGADVVFFDVMNQAEIVSEARPDVIIWAWPLIAQIPIKPLRDTISIVDLNGFQNIESAASSGMDQNEVTRALLHRARQADILVYGSPEQRAYWEGLFSLNYPSEALPAGFVLPFHAPVQSKRPYLAGDPDFFYVGSFLPWLSPFNALFTLADELKGTKSRLRVFASTQPTTAGEGTRSELMRLSDHPSVVLEHPLPYNDLYREIGFSGVAFDLLEESFERRFAYPIRSISYLTYGIPLLYNDFSCISAEIAQSGAGWTTSQEPEALRATIQGILTESHELRAGRSAAATHLSQRLFSCPDAWADLFDRLKRGNPRPAASRPRTARTPKPNVLVISDDEANILNLRCITPLRSLLRRDAIGGYVVVGKDGIRLSTLGTDGDAEVHSVIVQRVPQVPSVAILEMTGGRYIYDIDDNLLVQPAYRPPFPPDFAWKVRTLLANASAVSVTNQFLARSLACASGLDVAGRARVLPNPLVRRCHGVEDRPIRRVLFASSDELPLVDSAPQVFSAIGSFCRRRNLEFCYLGSYPNNPVFREYLAGVPIQSFEPRPYHEYLDMLEGLEALAVVPLETGGDPATIDFVRSKSDIKAVEYLGMGMAAVFSDAAPYRYSDLPIKHLVPNDADCWEAALEAAFTQTTSDRAAIAAQIEQRRWINGSISDLWLDTIQQNAMLRPLSVRRVVESVESSLTKLRFSAWPAENFDAMYYLAENRDVQLCMESGVFEDAYGHYLRHGRMEGRKASPYDTGRTLINHIEESKAAIITLDSEMNRTDHRIRQLKQHFGVRP